MSERKVPKIRFPGFTGEWEEQKLSHIYKDIGNAFVGTATPYYVEHGHFYLESNNVKDGHINHNSEIFINDEFYMKQKDKWLHTGDMVMVQSGHVGHAAVIPEELDNSAAHALIMFRNPKTEIEPYFLNYQYQTLKAKRKFENITTGNTIKHILASEMQEFVVDVSSYEEQKKIACFFRNLDNLISINRHECGKWKELKNGLLQKMFPKEGESVPEIRFPGFTDPWEQRKLSDFAQRESEFRVSSAKCPSVEYEDVVAEEGRLNKDIRRKETQKTGIAFDGTQVLYGKLRPYLHNWLNPDFAGVAVGDWWVLRPVGVNKKFLYRMLQTQRFDEVANQSSGSKMPRADWNLVSNTEFIIPPTLDEQRRIAETFDDLDTLITLHQRECDKWKELKKGMLQKMFPKEGESVPEIRFPGFGEPWEQRKLGDWCNIITKGTTPSTFCEDGEVTFVKIEAIRGKYVDKNLCSAIDENIHQTVLARSILKENDIVFAIAGATVGKCAIITADLLPANTNQALAIIRLKNCIDREFVYSSLMSSQMAKYIYESKSVGAQPNLSLAQINEFTFWCPTSQSEQQRIGQLISTFDILIYLYQLELEKWQSLKKALLQQMFV